MNSFSHAVRFLDWDRRFVVGTSIPDWLTMVDRRVRARRRLAQPVAANPDHPHNALAAGIVQHHEDDQVFHGNPSFIQLNLDFAREIRKFQTGGDAKAIPASSDAIQAGSANAESNEELNASFRPHFAAHILIEMLLDSSLAQLLPGKLEAYYQIVADIDPAEIQQGVNQIAVRSTDKLQRFIDVFLSERYIFDYLQDRGVLYRLNRILARIGLGQLDESILEWFPRARRLVDELRECLFPFELASPRSD